MKLKKLEDSAFQAQVVAFTAILLTAAHRYPPCTLNEHPQQHLSKFSLKGNFFSALNLSERKSEA